MRFASFEVYDDISSISALFLLELHICNRAKLDIENDARRLPARASPGQNVNTYPYKLQTVIVVDYCNKWITIIKVVVTFARECEYLVPLP